jgi:hypothetical protein
VASDLQLRFSTVLVRVQDLATSHGAVTEQVIAQSNYAQAQRRVGEAARRVDQDEYDGLSGRVEERDRGEGVG